MNSKIKAFVLALIFQLLITSLLHLKVRPPQLFNFLILPKQLISTKVKVNDSSAKVTQLLERKSNNFRLIPAPAPESNHYVPPTDAILPDGLDQAKAYFAINWDDGQVLQQKNSAITLPVASLTKILSAVVSLDLVSPDEEFTISQKAANAEPTTIGVVEGEKMSVKELLAATLLTSANDATQALADGIDNKFGPNAFVSAMNKKAQFLGLKSSHFTNPQGFDDQDNYSTAEDLSVLTKYALTNYPLIAEMVKQDYLFLPADSRHKQFDLYNWNGLLDVYPGVFGVKIGNTAKAGVATAVLSQRSGKKVLAIVLGAPGVLERDLWAAKLLDLSFGKLGLEPINISIPQLQVKYRTWKYWG